MTVYPIRLESKASTRPAAPPGEADGRPLHRRADGLADVCTRRGAAAHVATLVPDLRRPGERFGLRRPVPPDARTGRGERRAAEVVAARLALYDLGPFPPLIMGGCVLLGMLLATRAAGGIAAPPPACASPGRSPSAAAKPARTLQTRVHRAEGDREGVRPPCPLAQAAQPDRAGRPAAPHGRGRLRSHAARRSCSASSSRSAAPRPSSSSARSPSAARCRSSSSRSRRSGASPRSTTSYLVLTTLAASLKAKPQLPPGSRPSSTKATVPTAKEFNRVLTETRLGRPMDGALAEMAERVGSKNLRFVITAVTIQRQVGGSLAGIFDMVADAVRNRRLRPQDPVADRDGADGRLRARRDPVLPARTDPP